MKKIVLLCTILLTVSPFAKEIQFAYGDYQSSPYIRYDKTGTPVGGSLFDIAKFVSNRLGVGFKLVNTPRTRLERMVRAGHIDVYCSSNKHWVKRPEDFYWVEDIESDENFLYMRSDKFKDIQDLDEIKSPVGVIKGFVYHPDIERLVKRVGSHELRTHETLIKFLELGRVDTIISSKKILEKYYKKDSVAVRPLKGFSDKFSHDCIISKEMKFNKNKVIAALEKYRSRND